MANKDFTLFILELYLSDNNNKCSDFSSNNKEQVKQPPLFWKMHIWG